MIELPLWRECRKCTRFAVTADTPRCSDPFPISGICPHPGEREITISYGYQNYPLQSHVYYTLLCEDTRVASIFLRWRYGTFPVDSDYLYIRSLFFDSRYYLKDESPLDCLWDICSATLCRLGLLFCEYHLNMGAPGSTEDITGELPLELSAKLAKTLKDGFSRFFVVATPELIEANINQKSDWSRLMIDIVQLHLWDQFQCKHIDFSGMSDAQFRQCFEKEWKTLARFQDFYYGFAVTPKITSKDMSRYQNLSQGDVKIRLAINAYLTHRGTAYPFWINIFTDKFRKATFQNPLRESYRSLIQSLTRKAIKNLTAVNHGATTNQSVTGEKAHLKSVIEEQLWTKYDEYFAEYQFHWDHPDRKRPWGNVGFVGLQDAESKKEIDRRLEEMGLPIRTEHFSEVSFAHYIHEKLTHWLEITYPADAPAEKTVSLNNDQDEHSPLIERVSGNEGWNADGNSLPPVHNVVAGNDNINYITINALAKRSGMSVHQLRRLDKQGLVPFTRVKNVCKKPWPLSADVRLYPLTDEAQKALQLAKVRLEKHSSALGGNEIDRKTVAQMLGVSEGAIRKWENKGLVSPKRKGRIVVYDETALEQAKRIKEQKNSKL